MDAKQQRQLLAVSRKALAMLDPDWPIARLLSETLASASVKAVKPVTRARKGRVPIELSGAKSWIAWPPTLEHDPLMQRLLKEAECVHCSHDAGSHESRFECSQDGCSCDAFKDSDWNGHYGHCAICDHPKADHPKTIVCVGPMGREGSMAVTCACQKYKNSQPTFNIAVKAAEMANALKSKEAMVDGLDACACGHKSDRHTKDELENLLARADCDCDHFHYQAADQAEAA